MPSKRTNDSVNRIMEELSRRQAEEGVRAGMNDQQVDEILRSIGLGDDGSSSATVQFGPIDQGGMPDVTLGGDGTLSGFAFSAEDLAPPAPAQAPAPRQAPRAAAPAQAPAPRQAPRAAAAAPDTADTADTTQTGLIKNFLRQAVPEDARAGSADITVRKEQFKNFFKDSVAVVPDENGRLRVPKGGGKHRGLFGRGSVDDTTGEFVPINVAISAQQAERPAPEPPAAEAPAPAEAPPRDKPKKKRRGLFGGRRQEEELVIPEPQEETRTPALPPEDGDALPAPESPAYRSKYTAPQPEPPARTAPAAQAPALGEGATLSDDTLAALRLSIRAKNAAQAARETQDAYARTEPQAKKPDTVEFVPGQKPQPPRAAPRPRTPPSEPAAEPVMLPSRPVAPSDAPAREACLPAQGAPPVFGAGAGAPGPAEPLFPDTAAGLPGGDATTTGFSIHMDAITPEQLREKISTGEITREQLDAAAEEITRTITGQIRLAPDAPADVPVSTVDFAPPIGAQPSAPPDTSEFVSEIADSINRDEPATTKFAEAAARLTEREDDGRPAPRPPRLRLNGRPEEEDEDAEAAHPFGDAAAREDYENGENKDKVRLELDKQVLRRTAAVLVSGAAALVLLYLGTAAAGKVLPLPDPLDPLVAPGALLGSCLLLLAAAMGVCWRTVAAGLRGLLRAPTADSLPALAAAASAVQLLVLLLRPGWYAPEKLCLFAGPAALLLCLNGVGRLLEARTVRDNFDLVSAGVDHAAAYRLRDAKVVRAVTRGLSEPKPNVLVSRPTQLLKSFMADSGSRRSSDKNQQQFAWLLGGCALLSLVFNLVWSKDPGRAFTAMAAVLCLGSPLAGTLLSALPAQLMQRSAARVGAVIPGWKDIRQLGRTNVIQISARDLFPPGCVQQHGIRPIRNQRIDVAIVYAASMLVDSCPTLRDVFLGMLGGNRKLLHKVEELRSVPGKGYVGWIDSNRVLVGNRLLMAKYGIRLPTDEYERRLTVNQRKVIYLAVSGNLFAMFLIGYERDGDTAAVLENLRRSGISLVVTGDDFNCDAALLETVYTLPTGSVKVLNEAEGDLLAPAISWLPESDGCMLHLGNFASFVGGLEAAAGAAEGERKASIVLTASVLISCLLTVVMSITGGIASLPLPVLVVYQVCWAVLALIFPLIQKY